MLQKNSSEFYKNVQRLKGLLNSFQNTLRPIEDCPIMSKDDPTIIKIWRNEKGVKSLVNALSFTINNDFQDKIRPQDLQQYRANQSPCKFQFNQAEGDNSSKRHFRSKLQEFASPHKQFRSGDSDSSFSDDQSHDVFVKRQYKRGPYKNYTVGQKEQAVKLLLDEHYTVVEISRKLRIPCKNIKRWSQQGVLRKKGGGRKRFSPETEINVANLLRMTHPPGSEIQYQEVQEIARRQSQDENFKASRGWVVKFVDRQHLRNHYKFL